MSGLWLSFFRENCASLGRIRDFASAVARLELAARGSAHRPCRVFGLLTSFVLRRTEALQQSVERYNSTLAEQASDALGNVPVIQSFTRIEIEASALRSIIDSVLAAQMPVLTWWAIAGVGARASADLDPACDFPRRHLAQPGRPRHGRRDRHVHEFRHDADRPAGAGRRIFQQPVHAGAQIGGVFRRARHRAAGRR